MFGDGALTFHEFVMGETLPLATIHEAVLDFLKDRDDAVLWGAHAVNAYVEEPRMTQDVDVLCCHAQEFAELLLEHLKERLEIAIRIRTLAQGAAFRLYQVRKPKNRHLVDVRNVERLPPHQSVGGVLVLTPVELIRSKVLSATARPKTPKGMIDIADLRRLLLAFPDLKVEDGPIAASLRQAGAADPAFQTWRDLVSQEIAPEDDDTGY